MNKYLNSYERSHMMQVGAMHTVFDLVDQEYSKLKNTDKEFLRCARMCKTLTGKMIKIRTSYMDGVEVDKLLEQVLRHRIVIRPTDVALREQKEINKVNDKTIMETDDFLDLVGWTIETTCKVCTNTGEDVTECGLRKLMVKNDVEVFDASVKDKCPYQYPVVENKR